MLSATAANAGPTYKRAAEELRPNPRQWEAYESQGNCVVLAGPGSGKTKTLTIKLARMLAEDVRPPRGIACITYSTECARELERRLGRLGVSEAPNLFIGTVHSFCLTNVLLPYAKMAGLELPQPWSVAGENQQQIVFQDALMTVFGPGRRPSRLQMDSHRRTHLDRGAGDWASEPDLARLVEVYEQKLHDQNLIDFDDMMLSGLKLIEGHAWIRKVLKARFPILVVDEYQDLGVPLHRIVLSLCFEASIRLLAVGDPDQSIYGFTGARPELLRKLAARDGVQSVYLRMNYRCGTSIVKASEIILNEGQDRFETPEDTPPGVVICHEYPNGLSEQARSVCADLIPAALKRNPQRSLGDIAVLYLDKNDGDVIAQAAAAAGIAQIIRIDGNAPYKKTLLTRWLEDCAAWCAYGWRKGEPRLSALTRVWLRFNRLTGVSESMALEKKVTLVRFLWMHRRPDMGLHEWLCDFEQVGLLQSLHGIPELSGDCTAFRQLLTACQPNGPMAEYTVHTYSGQGGSPTHLNLITLHSAKGLEFEVVFIIGLEQGRIPWTNDSESQRAEKRRLFYVGVTRWQA